MRRSLLVLIGCLALLLVACASGPEVTVSAVCYPHSDPSMKITKPTIFADLTLSSHVENVPRVRIVLLDAAGQGIGTFDTVAGYVFPGETEEVTTPVGIPKGGVDAFASCTASVIGFGANPEDVKP